MKQEIEQFLGYVGTERGFSPKTVDAYRHDLGKFSEFADKELGKDWQVGDVDQYTIKAYMQFLADRGNAAVSRGRKLATLKSFFRYLTSEGRVKVAPTATIKMPKTQQKEPSYLTEQEYKRLLRTVQKNATKYFKARDTAIITMLLGMGLRLSELTELDVGNVNFEDGTIKVTRKGNQERILPANDEVMITLNRYLKSRENATAQQPLFLSKRNQRIGNGSVWHLVKKYLKQAQIEKDKLSPHTLRHTFATTLLRQGENLLTIKELLSHRNLRTTERYLHINGDDLKNAVNKISLTSK
ncbi:MAG: tyrosine-type recombinase/integrase [Dehalococcoidales bacterium]|nr:tyrosine-type recombinase/integrase [Dehalococcoidales bacterium]